MPQFSDESKQKLATCHLDLQILFNEVIKYFDCKVTEGYRDKEAQDKAVASGNSDLAWPNGKHNKKPSMAVDVYPCPVDFKKKERFYYFAGIVMGIAERLYADKTIKYQVRWGGDWDGDTDLYDQKLFDLVHFELY